MFEFAVFWIFAAILVIAASCVITVRNPVHSALFLVLAFFTAAALWMLLRAEFLAIALVLVYVGAVMVLFLFVVMMLDINLERLREGFWWWSRWCSFWAAAISESRRFPVRRIPGRVRATPRSSGGCSTPTTPIRSSSRRCCFWWLSSLRSR